ncbi:hypothetical protein CCAX7_18940 [Capsulimonas corticalis]|uniref:Uncharacterized protein n=1 Tax=Capsulimonas corticalis TaxID=2219043 RepID=A0A402D5D2_9BACT|nr:hypothetical protein [Capsulimonas corticalis]BDI29843.1 hypothetical protein CCAX7_18940 [Capsulimonas corticalis]
MNLKMSIPIIVAAAVGTTCGAGLPRTQADTVKPVVASAAPQDTSNAALLKRLDTLEKRVQQLEAQQGKHYVTFTPNSNSLVLPNEPGSQWRVTLLSNENKLAK